MTRKLPFEAIENFRDFGDYGAGERRIRKGVLYRAAHQAEATDADLDSLAALGLSLIVDLRRPNERTRSPSRRWNGFSAEVIENGEGDEHDDPWHRFIAGSDLTAKAFAPPGPAWVVLPAPPLPRPTSGTLHPWWCAGT